DQGHLLVEAPTGLIRPWQLRRDGSCSRVQVVGRGVWDRGKPLAFSGAPFLEASSRSPSASFFLTPVWAKALVPLVGGGGMSMALPPWRRRLGFAGVWMVLLCLLRTRWRRSAHCSSSSRRGLHLVPTFFSLRLNVWFIIRWW
uniref:Uncharacterized protein n=1 Tax=Triticum urartu TaxID=4572 RepID=A0A8R7K3W4_TRIUA